MYSEKFEGLPTASGAPFRQNEVTAAHKRLPLGSRVKVTNLRNGRSMIVRITDRGPHVRGRILDLSQAAARQLAMADEAPVKLEPIHSSGRRH